MTPHDHSTYVEGCFRCDLSRDEAKAQAEIDAGRAVTFDDPDEAMCWLQDVDAP